MSVLTQDLDLLKKTYKETYKKWCAQWLLHMMKNPDRSVIGISPDALRLGGFYFMQYDLRGANKTSKLEQYTPFLLVDYRPGIDKRVIYALNLNFLTTQKKEAFFSQFVEPYDELLTANKQKPDWAKEQPLPGVNYERMFQELMPFAFEYAVREYRLDLINGLYAISNAHLAKVISLDTQQFTGVDEAKLNDIWLAKLRTEGMEQRVLDVVSVKSNYQRILTELAEKFKNLNTGR